MKTLITASDVREYAKTGEKTMPVEAGAIITPAAWDEAKEMAIAILPGASEKTEGNINANSRTAEVDPGFLARVVGEVIACLQKAKLVPAADKDPCGLKLIRGEQVTYSGAVTGGLQDKVQTAELIGSQDSKQLAVRSVKLHDAVFPYETLADTTVHIITGTLECTVHGRQYRGSAGDSFFIPARQTVTLSTTGQATCSIVAPAAG